MYMFIVYMCIFFKPIHYLHGPKLGISHFFKQRFVFPIFFITSQPNLKHAYIILSYPLLILTLTGIFFSYPNPNGYPVKLFII